MSGREAGRESNPEVLEVVPGSRRDNVEGSVPTLASESEIKDALEHAFGYRGDVTITRKDGTRVEGYVFDRRTGKSLSDSVVRLIPKDGTGKLSVAYSDIAGLAFSGRDMAAGKSWETWVKQYWERRAAGEKNISLEPEQIE